MPQAKAETPAHESPMGWFRRTWRQNIIYLGFVAIFLTGEVRKRGDLPRAGLFVGLTTWVLAIAFKKINLLHIYAAGVPLNYSALAMQSVVAIGMPQTRVLLAEVEASIEGLLG